MKSDELNSLMDAPVRVRGRLFEDYEVGQEFIHHWGRTMTQADSVLFTTLTMNTQALHLDAAGLQWVQTDPNKAPVEAIAEPPPQLGRKPKRSQQTAESEPMVMVETRSSEQPPAS